MGLYSLAFVTIMNAFSVSNSTRRTKTLHQHTQRPDSTDVYTFIFYPTWFSCRNCFGIDIFSCLRSAWLCEFVSAAYFYVSMLHIAPERIIRFYAESEYLVTTFRVLVPRLPLRMNRKETRKRNIFRTQPCMRALATVLQPSSNYCIACRDREFQNKRLTQAWKKMGAKSLRASRKPFLFSSCFDRLSLKKTTKFFMNFPVFVGGRPWPVLKTFPKIFFAYKSRSQIETINKKIKGFLIRLPASYSNIPQLCKQPVSGSAHLRL